MSGTEQITIRLPAERVARLKAAAQAEHRSLARQIEHMLTIADEKRDDRPRRGLFIDD